MTAALKAGEPVRLDWPERHSQTPKEVFQREDIYRRELERIFYGPEWHLLAHRSELPAPGDYKTHYIGEAPVLLVHGDDGRLRVFLNSCAHRGTQLKTDFQGSSREIECPYHRWLFSLRGELVSAPDMSQFPQTFRKEDYHLAELRSEERYGLVFATFDPKAPALAAYLGTLDEYMSKALCGDGRLKLVGYQKVTFDTNWKEYNDQEGYHAPLLHRAFRLLRWQGGRGSRWVSEYGHYCVEARLQKVASDFLRDPSLVQTRDPAEEPRSVVVTFFALGIVLKHLDVISVRYAFPRSVHETEVHYAYFHHADDDAGMIAHRVRQASNLLGPSGLISLEDGAVFNRQHRGSTTPGLIEFQRGVGEPLRPPVFIGTNDEAANPAKWARYRAIMDFAHG